MRLRYLIAGLALACAAMHSQFPAFADDWSFIAGNYAIDAEDCSKMAGKKPFSKELVDTLSGSQVMSREGITAANETHCKFKSVSGSDGKWTVKSSCEEMGSPSDADVAIAAGDGGNLIVTQADWYGDPLTFVPCGK